jgi:hypothetical protein
MDKATERLHLHAIANATVEWKIPQAAEGKICEMCKNPRWSDSR